MDDKDKASVPAPSQETVNELTDTAVRRQMAEDAKKEFVARRKKLSQLGAPRFLRFKEENAPVFATPLVSIFALLMVDAEGVHPDRIATVLGQCPRFEGTLEDPDLATTEARRALSILDFQLRVLLPFALDLYGHKEQAEAIRISSPIHSHYAMSVAYPELRKVYEAVGDLPDNQRPLLSAVFGLAMMTFAEVDRLLRALVANDQLDLNLLMVLPQHTYAIVKILRSLRRDAVEEMLLSFFAHKLIDPDKAIRIVRGVPRVAQDSPPKRPVTLN